MIMTYQIAYAIGTDAGNKSKQAAGRKAWNTQDYNAARAAMVAALKLIPGFATEPKEPK
jgi:hypothetical protein